MTTTTHTSWHARAWRPLTITAIGAGLTLTLGAGLFPLLDVATASLMAAHVARGYPAYSGTEVGVAASAYAWILAGIGLFGAAGWLATLITARSHPAVSRWLAAGLLVVGLMLAASGLTVTDTSGAVGLAPVMGWLLLAPCVAGIATTALLWRRTSGDRAHPQI